MRTILLLCLCAICTAACGDQRTPPPSPGPTGIGGPPFPVDKAASDIVTSRNGWDSHQRSPGCEAVEHMDGPALRIPGSTAAPLEWATYRFSCLDNTPLELIVQFGYDSYPSSDAWIGVANYATNRWEMHGPYDYEARFDLSADYRSPAGNVFVSVLGYSSKDSYVWWMQLTTTGTQAPPVVSFNPPQSARIAGSDYTLDATPSHDPDGSIVKYEWDLDRDGLFETVGGPQATITIPDWQNGIGSWGLRVTDNDGLSDTGFLQLLWGLDVPPKAEFSANPPLGAPGQPVQLDAYWTYDPVGDLVKLEWDLDGDGSYELDTGLAKTVDTAYPPSGRRTIGLRATDDTGYTGEFHTMLTTTARELHPDGDSPVSMVMVNGHPAMLFEVGSGEPNQRGLYYNRALDAGGTQWAAPLLIEGGNLSAGALAVVAGRPAITYGGGLTYRIASDADGTTWSAPVAIGLSDNLINDSLVVAAGHPALAFSAGPVGDRALYYCRALDAQGLAWDSPQLLDDIDSTGFAGLSIVAGQPAVLYNRSTLETPVYAWYVRASDTQGLDWGSPAVLSASTAFASQLLEVNGLPAATVRQSGELCYMRAVDADGTGWQSAAQFAVDFRYTRLALIDGRPAIAYNVAQGPYLQAPWKLELLLAADANGDDWSAPLFVDSTDEYDGYALLDLQNGNVGFSYMNQDNRPLQFDYVAAY